MQYAGHVYKQGCEMLCLLHTISAGICPESKK